MTTVKFTPAAPLVLVATACTDRVSKPCRRNRGTTCKLAAAVPQDVRRNFANRRVSDFMSAGWQAVLLAGWLSDMLTCRLAGLLAEQHASMKAGKHVCRPAYLSACLPSQKKLLWSAAW
jgi:hypothetical protein